MDIQPYDAERDLASIQRIWREVGWIDSDAEADGMEHFLVGTDSFVALIDDEAECAVLNTPGAIRYQDVDLDLSIISGVTTSLIGRKQGLATRLTAHTLAAAARNGAQASILGMFEQGFYNMLGFGSGTYEHHLRFDPATVHVDVPYRRPIRLVLDDWEEMHATFSTRYRHHGGVTAHLAGFTRAEMIWTDKPFGLGYRNSDGELTHFVWGRTKGEFGPYRIAMMSYQNQDQLLELLKLVSSLGDQVRSIGITEPAGIQMQDLLRHVVRQEVSTAKSDHEFRHASGTWWQLRMLDVPACVGARSYDGPPLRFVAELTDPVQNLVDDGWNGVSGSYIVTIGETSKAEPGTDPTLPVLRASVNAFSRAWFGVRAPSSIAVTDDLAGSPELLKDLDRALALPQPHPGMFF